MADKLATYRAKRRFDRTPEPSGGKARGGRVGPRYVIQKHAASRLHYDFRLEHDGVLWSWSVPKGPSLAPADRRLAVRTEDHPIDYADFEGIIPAGEYGGGAVIVWDHGSWEPDGDAGDGMKRGRLTFTLHGDKLRGRWHLVRTKMHGGDRRENWLLFKGRDAEADDARDITADAPESAVSGRTIEEVGAAPQRVWHSNRAAEPDRFARRRIHAAAQKLAAAVGIQLTNPDKVLYPEAGLTKAQLVAYIAAVADWMLPHIARRPLTLVRCPDGRHRQCFYQKHAFAGVPDFIERMEIAEEEGSGIYMFVDDLTGLVALAQLGVLELHTWGAHADDVERPDQLVFDVDPDLAVGWEDVVATALLLRERLGDLGLDSFVKTTGGKGLHVVAPIQRRLRWDEVKAFTRGFAGQLAAEQPDRFTINPLKKERRGRLFLDYLRNTRGASAVVPYSPRAREGAPVAAPLTWEELVAGVEPATFNLTSMPRRLADLDVDPWAGYADVRQGITAAMQRQVQAAAGRRPRADHRSGRSASAAGSPRPGRAAPPKGARSPGSRAPGPTRTRGRDRG
jgi:bifunctional non-homologous end joining protein LigD